MKTVVPKSSASTGTLHQRYDSETFFNELIEWVRKRYMYILIDSRTGVTDTASLHENCRICLSFASSSIDKSLTTARKEVWCHHLPTALFAKEQRCKMQ